MSCAGTQEQLVPANRSISPSVIFFGKQLHHKYTVCFFYCVCTRWSLSGSQCHDFTSNVSPSNIHTGDFAFRNARSFFRPFAFKPQFLTFFPACFNRESERDNIPRISRNLWQACAKPWKYNRRGTKYAAVSQLWRWITIFFELPACMLHWWHKEMHFFNWMWQRSHDLFWTLDPSYVSCSAWRPHLPWCVHIVACILSFNQCSSKRENL